MIWSPLSNLLLYGGTARVDAARAAGVRIGLGSDWSPTGSKNLLGELKVAWLYSQHALNGLLTARDLVAMATRDAARILKWEGALGTIDAGKRADLLVIDGTAGDPYDALIRAKETDIRLVMINGVARYGVPALMAPLAPEDQTVTRGRPIATALSEAGDGRPGRGGGVAAHGHRQPARRASQHRQACQGGGEAEAGGREEARPGCARPPGLVAGAGRDPGPGSRPAPAPAVPRTARLHRSQARRARGRPAAPPLSTILKPIHLDPLTVADDEDFLDAIEQQPNVPAPIKNGLRGSLLSEGGAAGGTVASKSGRHHERTGIYVAYESRRGQGIGGKTLVGL